jgi:hypothetical protein
MDQGKRLRPMGPAVSAASTDASSNVLYYGDNLDVLRRHVKDETVDLVYLDPPFNSNTTYNVLFAEHSGERAAAQIKAFEDTWRWDQAAAGPVKAGAPLAPGGQRADLGCRRLGVANASSIRHHAHGPRAQARRRSSARSAQLEREAPARGSRRAGGASILARIMLADDDRMIANAFLPADGRHGEGALAGRGARLSAGGSRV